VGLPPQPGRRAWHGDLPPLRQPGPRRWDGPLGPLQLLSPPGAGRARPGGTGEAPSSV